MKQIYKRLIRKVRKLFIIGRYEEKWWWLAQAPTEEGIAITELVVPLRYDIVIRKDFITFYLANQNLYHTDFARFLELALQHPYYVCFQKMYPQQANGDTDLTALFAQKIKDFVALYHYIAEFGFDETRPIIPKTGLTILPTKEGKKVSSRFFMGDGCHRLACLMALGYQRLPAAYMRVKCFTTLAPVDGTIALLNALPIDHKSYFAFLSSRYAAPHSFTSATDLLSYCQRESPQFLDEILSVIHRDELACMRYQLTATTSHDFSSKDNPMKQNEEIISAQPKRVKRKVSLKARLRKVPIIGAAVMRGWETAKTLWQKTGWEIVNNKISWISPARLEFVARQRFDPQKAMGQVIDGDWDRLTQKVVDTDLFQKALSAKSTLAPLQAQGQITVNIGREGDLLVNDGLEDVCIAKLLARPKIPVRIVVRHPQWLTFRKELQLAFKDRAGKPYQPLTHPDLVDVPSEDKDSEHRFTLIKANVSTKEGKLLDIGANLGYFCHRFEDEGFDCYAVEQHPQILTILRKLKRAEGKKFTIIADSILDNPDILQQHFDVVLALNIFHHFLKRQESYDKLVGLLHNLQATELFFQSHHPHEKQMTGAYKNYFAPDDFVKFLLDNSSFTQADFIAHTADGRSLYRLHT